MKNSCSQLTENQAATLLSINDLKHMGIKKHGHSAPIAKVLLKKKLIKRINQKWAKDDPNYNYYAITSKGKQTSDQCYRTGKWGKSPARKEAERDIERMISQAGIGHILGSHRKR